MYKQPCARGGRVTQDLEIVGSPYWSNMSSLIEVLSTCGPAGVLMVTPVGLTQLGSQRAREPDMAVHGGQPLRHRNRAAEGEEWIQRARGGEKYLAPFQAAVACQVNITSSKASRCVY